MNFDEAKKALLDGYARLGFTAGYRTQIEDANGVYLTRANSKFIIDRDEIQSYSDFQVKRPTFELLPISCGVCSTSYREHILVPTDPYPYASPGPFYQNIPIAGPLFFGTPSKEKIYAEMSSMSNDFLNFFCLDQDFFLSFNNENYRRHMQAPAFFLDPPERTPATNIKDTYQKLTTIKVYNLSETNIQNAFKKSSKIIEDCLFELSYLIKVALWLMEEWPNKTRFKPSAPKSFQFGTPYQGTNLPLGPTFNSDAIRFYMLGITSRIPELSFLAFYQVLEYFFVSVSNEKLYEKIANQIKDPKFTVSQKQIDQLVQVVDKHKHQTDETEMLKNVLNKYVDEAELIQFISSYEKHLSQSVYTTKHNVFGSEIVIPLQENHAIGNTAKHIIETRNAIVHSTDRYEGEVRHIPFTETTAQIERDIPLIKFLAERVIISSANPR